MINMHYALETLVNIILKVNSDLQFLIIPSLDLVGELSVPLRTEAAG